MLSPGKAVKVTIYLSEGSTRHGVPVYTSILDFLFYRGVAGATVTKGIAGFGADHHMHSANLIDLADHLPVKIEFIESREKVDSLLNKLQAMAGTGLIEMQETNIAKPARTTKDLEKEQPEHLKIEGHAQLMRIYLNEEDRWNGKPLYKALVEAMRSNDLAGVTVYKGFLGYGSHHQLHGDESIFSLHHGSIMLSTVDTAEKLRAFLPIVDQMVQEGLVTFSDVDIIKYAHRSPDVQQDIQSEAESDKAE